jgi:transketolase
MFPDKISLSDFQTEQLSEKTIQVLTEASRKCRAMAITMTSVANSGHPAGSLSSMEMYLSAYGMADLNLSNCNSPDRDYLVISHGHTSPGAYAALSFYGFVDPWAAMAHFRQAGSPFQGHVERDVPGIDWGTGNLGQGLSAGVGYALAQRARGHEGRVFVLSSDGEQTKGQIAEARRIAVKEGLSDITVLLDYNHIQISGRIEDIMPASLRALWEADGWNVLECDGHSFQEIHKASLQAFASDLPTVILCHTMMGKGVSFMEDVPDYHGKAASGDLLDKALHELNMDKDILEKVLALRNGDLPPGRKMTFPSIDLVCPAPVTYGPEIKTDNRSAFGKALSEVGSANYLKEGKTPLLVFDCDLASSVKTSSFAEKCPEWFIQAGIQEHSVATVAGSASAGGVVSLWADFGVFGLCEAYNQQRLNDINNSNLKLALTHVGLDVGEDGMTHQCIDYVGLLRNTFGWKLVVPADPNQTDRATRWALAERGNICLAMGRSKTDIILREDGHPFFGEDYSFEYGRYDMIRDGSCGAILAMGSMLPVAFRAWKVLMEKGIQVKLFNVSCPLQLDEPSLREAASTGAILTCEDHNVNSGMGSIVASGMASLGLASRICSMGVSRYGTSGKSSEVFEHMGLGVDNVVSQMEKLLRKN